QALCGAKPPVSLSHSDPFPGTQAPSGDRHTAPFWVTNRPPSPETNLHSLHPNTSHKRLPPGGPGPCPPLTGRCPPGPTHVVHEEEQEVGRRGRGGAQGPAQAEGQHQRPRHGNGRPARPPRVTAARLAPASRDPPTGRGGAGRGGAGGGGDKMAVCIAVIAKENYPLYIRSVPTENELKFHYTVHTSLDVVDEKISAMGKALVDQRELYLGLLYPTEDYKVYGYVTNSKVKFVMVVDSSNTALRDNEIRSMFRKLHNSYTDIMCNPFYNPGDRIHSRAFDSMVNSMMMQVC
uniref:Trafficking protein particle complex subunit 2-like protein n=3 Tax=Neoaves TaxID=3078114 RepID=A0A8C4UC24_FALTI